jgi:hypothetical protein
MSLYSRRLLASLDRLHGLLLERLGVEGFGNIRKSMRSANSPLGRSKTKASTNFHTRFADRHQIQTPYTLVYAIYLPFTYIEYIRWNLRTLPPVSLEKCTGQLEDVRYIESGGVP